MWCDCCGFLSTCGYIMWLFACYSGCVFRICPGTDTCSDIRADIVFVVDSSGSIRDADPGTDANPNPNYTFMRQFMANIVDGFTIGPNDVQVGAVTFSNEGVNRFFLNTYNNQADLTAALLNLAYDGGNTNTSGGLRRMHEDQFSAANGGRDNVDKIAIVITDGISTYDKELTIPEAETARNKGITIYAVGVTDAATTGAGRQELSLMSSLPQVENENWFAAPDFDTLNTIEETLLTAACDDDPSKPHVANLSASMNSQRDACTFTYMYIHVYDVHSLYTVTVVVGVRADGWPWSMLWNEIGVREKALFTDCVVLSWDLLCCLGTCCAVYVLLCAVGAV